MISCLVVIICILALSQSSHQRAVIACIYAAVVGLHSLAFYDCGGELYYLSAALADLVIIAVISVWAAPSRLAENLIDISLISICLNAFGFIVWCSKLPPESYNISYGALYLIAILALLREDCADGYQSSRRHTRLRVLVGKCAAFCRSLPEQKT